MAGVTHVTNAANAANVSSGANAVTVTSATEELLIQRVEVRFVGAPPRRQIERAAGVSEVDVDGRTLRCLVCGSFQPFLEALRGYEVISLISTAARAPSERKGRQDEATSATARKECE